MRDRAARELDEDIERLMMVRDQALKRLVKEYNRIRHVDDASLVLLDRQIADLRDADVAYRSRIERIGACRPKPLPLDEPA
jgi:hypothetical protein